MDENPSPDTDTNTEGDRRCSESHLSVTNVESGAVLNTSKLVPVQCSYIVNSPKYSAKKKNLDLEDIQRKRNINLNEALQNAKEKELLPLGDNVAFSSLLPGGEINVGLLFENSCMKRVDNTNQSVECRSHHYDGYIAGRKLWEHAERRELQNAKGFETKDVFHKPQNPENANSKENTVCKSAKLRSEYANKHTKAKVPSGDGRLVDFLYHSPKSEIGVHEISNKEKGSPQWEIGYSPHSNTDTLKQQLDGTFKNPNNTAYFTKPKRPTSSPQNLKSASVASSFLESRSCKNRKILNEPISKNKRESNHSNNFITDTDANGNSLEKGSTMKGKIHDEFFEGKEAVEAINSALGKRALSLYRNDIRNIAAQMENFPQAPADNAESYRGFQELHLESEKRPWVKEGLDGIDIDAKFGHLTNLVCCDEVNCSSETAKIIIQKNMKLMDNKLREDDTSYDDSFSSPKVRKRPCVIKTSPQCASKSKQHRSEHDGVVRSGKNNNRSKKDSTQSEHCKPPRHVRGGNARASPRKSDLTVGNVREMTKRYHNQKSIDVFEKVNAWIKHDMTVLTSGAPIGNPEPLECEQEESSASKSKKQVRSKNENASPTTVIEDLHSKSTRSTVKELSKKQGDCANTGKEDKMTSCTTLRKKNKRNRKLPNDHLTRRSEYSSCTDKDEFISAKSTLTAKLVNNRSPDIVCKQESPPIQFVEYIHYAPVVQRKISRSRKRSPKPKRRLFSPNPDRMKKDGNFWKRTDSPKRGKKMSIKGDSMLSALSRKRNTSLHRGKDHKNATQTPKRRARSLHVSRIDSSRSPGQFTFSSSPRRKNFHSRKPIEVNIETKSHNQPRTKEEKWERILIKEKIREASKKQAEDVNRLIKENEEQLDRKLQAIEKRRKVGVPKLNLYKYIEQPSITEDTCDYYNPHHVQNLDIKTVDYEQGGVYYQKAKKAGNDRENDEEEDDDDMEETAHYHKNWKVDYLEYLRGRELYTGVKNSDSDITVEAIQQSVLKTKTRKQRINFNSLMMPEMRVENVSALEGENAKQSNAQNFFKQRVDWEGDVINRVDGESMPKKKKRRQKKIYVVKRNNKRSKSASSTESNTVTLSKNKKQLQNCQHERGTAVDLKHMSVSKADSLPIAENTACVSVSQQRHLAKAKTLNNEGSGNITPVVQKLVEEYLRNENMLIQSQRLQEELNSMLLDQENCKQETNKSEQTNPHDVSELTNAAIATESQRNQKHNADQNPNEQTSLFFASSADINAIAGLRESQQNGEQDATNPLVLQDVEVELDANGCVREKEKDKIEVEVQTEMNDFTAINVPKPALLSFNKDVPLLSTDNEDLFDTILKFSRTNPIPSPVVQLFVHEPNDKDLASNVKSLCQAIDGAKDALHKMKRQRLFLNGGVLDSHEKAHLVSDVKIQKCEPTAEPLEKGGKKVDKGSDPVSNPVGIESTDNLFPASKTRAIILEAIASVLKNVRRKSLEEVKINDQKVNDSSNGGQNKTTHSVPDCKPSELNPELKARNMPPAVTDENPKQSKNQNKPRLKRRQRQYKSPYERQSSEFGCDFVSPPKAVLHPNPRQRSPSAKSAPQSIVSSCTKSATYLPPNTTLGRLKQRLESPTTKHCENIGRSQIRIKNKSTTLNTRPSSIDSHMSSPCRQPYTASRIRKPTTDNPNSKTRKRIPNSLPRVSCDPADDEEEHELPFSEPTKKDFNYGEEQIARLSRALAQEFLNQTGFVLGGELKRNWSDSSARKPEGPANKSQQNTTSYGNDNPSDNSGAMESPQRNNVDVDKARTRTLASGLAEMARYGGMFEDFTQGIQSFGPTNKTALRTRPKVQQLAAKKRLLNKRETLAMPENNGDPNKCGRSVCFNKQSPERVNNICDKRSNSVVSPQKTTKLNKPIYSWNADDRSFDSGGYVDPSKKAKSGPLPKHNGNESTRQRLARAQQIGEGVCDAINKEISCDRAGLNCTKLSGHFKPTDRSNIDSDDYNDVYEEYDDEEDNESRYPSEDEEEHGDYMITKELKNFEDVNNKGVASAEIKMYDKAGSMKSNLGNDDEGDNKDDDFDDDCTVEDMICDQIARCIELVNHSGDKALKACSDIEEALDYSIDEDINYDRVDDANYDNEDVIDDGNDNGEDDQLDRDDQTECNSNRNEFNDDDQEEDEEERNDDEEEEEEEDEEEEYADEDYDDDREDEDLDTFSVISCMSNDVNGVSLDRNDSREEEEGEEEDEVEDEEEENEEDNEEDEEEEDDEEEENTNGKDETDDDEMEEKQEKDDDDNDDDVDIEGREEEWDEEDADEEGEEDDEADVENCEEVTVIQRYGCYEKGESMPPNYDDDLNDNTDGVGDTLVKTVNTSNVVDEQLYDEWIHKSDNSNLKDDDYDDGNEEEEDGIDDDCDDNDKDEIYDDGDENDRLSWEHDKVKDVNDNRREDDDYEENDDDEEDDEPEYEFDDADDVMDVGVVQNNENEQFAV